MLQWIVMEGGVEALSFERLAEACRERGMRVYGMSEARLRAQLQQWLELSRVRTVKARRAHDGIVCRTSKYPKRCCCCRARCTFRKM